MNVSLKTLLSAAYGLSPVRITGPGWLDYDRFDVDAKAPAGVADSELMPMLQSPIKDRFQAAVHREAKDMLTYDMTAAKDGLKLQPFDPEHPPVTPSKRGANMLIGAGTMSQIADALTHAAGRPVLDRTGIAGRYGYVLTYTPISVDPPDSRLDPSVPDFLPAVQQQMGIRLDSKTQAVDILVVNRAERAPEAN